MMVHIALALTVVTTGFFFGWGSQTMNKKKRNSLKEMREWRPAEFSKIPFGMIKEISSKSPELGKFLLNINTGYNLSGIYPAPGDDNLIFLYGPTDNIAFKRNNGRTTHILVDNTEYPINKELWNILVEKEPTFKVLNNYT